LCSLFAFSERQAETAFLSLVTPSLFGCKR